MHQQHHDDPRRSREVDAGDESGGGADRRVVGRVAPRFGGGARDGFVGPRQRVVVWFVRLLLRLVVLVVVADGGVVGNASPSSAADERGRAEAEKTSAFHLGLHAGVPDAYQHQYGERELPNIDGFFCFVVSIVALGTKRSRA